MTNNYVEAVNSLKARLNHLHDSEGQSWGAIVKRQEYLGISQSTAWRIATTDYMPIGNTRRLLGLPPKRVRIAADVTEEQRQRLHEMAPNYGLTYSQLIRAIADYKALLVWPDNLDLNLFTCRRDDPAQVARQIAKYLPDFELVKKE